jgi:hypothetical protein
VQQPLRLLLLLLLLLLVNWHSWEALAEHVRALCVKETCRLHKLDPAGSRQGDRMLRQRCSRTQSRGRTSTSEQPRVLTTFKNDFLQSSK